MQQNSGCPGCGSPIKAEQVFCGVCGTKLMQEGSSGAYPCPGCGAAMNPGQSVCSNCGAGTQAAAGTQPDASYPVSKPQVAPGWQPSQQHTGVRYVSAVQPPPPEAPPMQMKPVKRPGLGLLESGGALFAVLGWVVLVLGGLGSIAMIVLSALGGG
ncbi:MAG TPA: zinc ribbon domain-containing protein, partial [Dehalococcoidia bacterium]|nr:zinc ribbon domain-containing protein [Dehalococcoidia bacterium]